MKEDEVYLRRKQPGGEGKGKGGRQGERKEGTEEGKEGRRRKVEKEE